MNILAFESSCDETSAAVVQKNENGFTVKSNIVASQIETHRLYGGVVPEIASRAHIEAISKITYEALLESGITLSEIDLVAVTSNPGLIGALLVGVNFAKALATANSIPLVAVDHIKGHIAAAYLSGDRIPTPPYIALAASGGHTSIYKVTDYTELEVIGATRDDAIGESYDKIGRIIGIPYPAGRGFDELAREGFILATGDSELYYEKYKKSEAYRNPDMTLPSPALAGDTLDFSFSGLKTAAINLLHRYEQRGEQINRALFAARYTYEATEAVAKKISAALEKNPDCNLVLSGGVAANSHLRKRLSAVAKEHGRNIFIPPLSLCGDNAAMIGAAAYYEYLKGNLSDSSLNASAQDSI
ncbi:MAG: tRNA (adenosine(37)-N6)-threonylcarbamoyltransferase complex transferase subunit TsaD [Ruminococcaceae bacterium]|nr:tRNA (adenosine(37)-N6)-threonylcarbamoyltransferase complex transferase subunit TsaD [Oscillospiraceae bacterium]